MAEYPDYNAIEDYNIMGIPVRLDQTLPENTVRITNDDDLSPTLQALSTLHEVYYKRDSNVHRHRQEVEECLWRLMLEYDRYLG